MTRGLKQEFVRLRTISQNQANLDTPGFRQTLSGLRQGKMDRWRDDVQGSLKETGRGLDITPREGTFFEVQRGRETYLTTRGDLKRDAQGFLVVGSGERILDESGSTIRVESIEKLGIDEAGNVYSDGDLQTVLRRVTATEVKELGGTLFSPTDNSKITQDDGEILVGTLNSSNADLTRNQTDLVATIHRARVYTQAATLQDSTIERAIREMLGS